jgi:Domain of Unknown Function with PDB structure (DUF3857)
MIKPYSLLIVGMFALSVNAQTTAPIPTLQPYGKIDKEDLELKSCDFEKDANAEMLFSKGTVYFDSEYNIIFERHVRIKIFNDKGKDEANIKLKFRAGDQSEYITNILAETVNQNNGALQITKVDKKQIFTQKIDKRYSEIAFSFPDVKAGSIIEYKYTLTINNVVDFPDWYFQTDIPTRYSEFSTTIPNVLYYKNLVMVNQPWAKNTSDVKALANIPSLNDEPYMSSIQDNAERILYELKTVSVPNFNQSFSDTWEKVGKDLAGADDFGGQFRRKLAGEDVIISKAKSLHSDAEKIAYVFNEVKSTMKWDEEDERYTNDGTAEAWNKKTGNSTEINLILCHLLQKSGLKVYPMLVSTKDNGKINPAYPNSYQFNRTVAYIPVDSTFNYVLDATSKYNIYNETPRTLLNGFGFYVNKDDDKYDLVFLQKTTPVRAVTLITAEIKPDGKMTGTVQVNSFSYNRINDVKEYKTDGEEKYIKALSNGDNNLKITSLKFENMEVDTLPLTQNIEFNLDLTGSDENYIYFKPNLFASDYNNEFLSETRFTDIDFGYQSNYSLNGIYKVPAGYKIDAMPKSVSMAMTDKSIVFKRVVAEQDGSVVVRYMLYFKKALYFKEDYPEIHGFFKKMNEMMNEQIVLKKG